MTSMTARTKKAAGIHDPKFPAHVRLTPAQIHARALDRADRRMETGKALLMSGISRHEFTRFFDDRAPHASRSTPERLHGDRRPARERAKLAYATGLANNANGLHANGKPMPWKYLNSGTRLRMVVEYFERSAEPLAA